MGPYYFKRAGEMKGFDFTLAFVLVTQPSFGQQAQTKLLGLREISFWVGHVAHGPGPPSPKALSTNLKLEEIWMHSLPSAAKRRPFLLHWALLKKIPITGCKNWGIAHHLKRAMHGRLGGGSTPLS